METFFNKVKASVRKPDETGDYFILFANGERNTSYFDGKVFRLKKNYGTMELTQQPEYWLEELPVITEVLFNTPNCMHIKDFKLNVAGTDHYAAASTMAIRTYAYTIRDHDSRLARLLHACVDKQTR